MAGQGCSLDHQGLLRTNTLQICRLVVMSVIQLYEEGTLKSHLEMSHISLRQIHVIGFLFIKVQALTSLMLTPITISHKSVAAAAPCLV